MADVDADVVDVGGGSVEDEVAGLEFVGRNAGPGVELVVGDAGDGDAGGLADGAGEAGAVEAVFSGGRSVSAPEVGQAELSFGVGDGFQGGRAGVVVAADGGGGLVLGGLGEDVGDVPLGVVVGVDRVVEVVRAGRGVAARRRGGDDVVPGAGQELLSGGMGSVRGHGRRGVEVAVEARGVRGVGCGYGGQVRPGVGEGGQGQPSAW